MKNKHQIIKHFLIAAVMLICIMFVALACAETERRINLPQDVQNYLATSRWKGWEVTAWVSPQQQKSRQITAFAAVKNGISNTLLAFGKEKDGWVYKWNNPTALPQVAEPIVLGEVTGKHVNFTSFYVYNNEIQEMFCIWQQQANGAWMLQELHNYGYYQPEKGLMFFDASKEGVLKLSNKGWVEGKETDMQVYGVYQRNLRHFNLSDFPLTLEEARAKLSNPPSIPYGDLEAQNIKFTSGKKYPVYTGPGKDYLRSAKGKASVSTNDWIQVFGRVEDWILIQYDITSSQMRIGYIDAASLPKKVTVPELSFDSKPIEILKDTVLTDEPLMGQTTIGKISAGKQDCYFLAAFSDEWSYIQTTLNGKKVCGFVRTADVRIVE